MIYLIFLNVDGKPCTAILNKSFACTPGELKKEIATEAAHVYRLKDRPKIVDIKTYDTPEIAETVRRFVYPNLTHLSKARGE